MDPNLNPWLEANKRFLSAELARLKGRLGGPEAGASPAPAPPGPEELPAPAAIDDLSAVFGLTPFERDLLLLCAGVEMDAELASRCAASQGHTRGSQPTFGLALASLEDPHWSALTPTAPLRHWRLLEMENGPSLTGSFLRIDERILHFLAGVNVLDHRLEPLLRFCEPPETMAEGQLALAGEMGRLLAQGEALAVQLRGDDPRGQEDVAARAARARGLFLYRVQAADLPPVGPDLESFRILWSREAALLPAALLIQCEPGAPPATATALAEKAGGLVFFSCREPVPLRRPLLVFDVDKPGPLEQKRLWTRALGPSADKLNGSLDALAGQFRLSAQAILEAGSDLGRRMEDDPRSADLLWHTCRVLGRNRLDDLAQRIESAADWDDLVLPEAEKAVLRQIAAQVKHRLRVHETWGFAAKGKRGLGVSALFAGESGTGKTMAAEVLARELKLDLYRIDLSSVVSKYIGETEKNLRKVFDAAEDGGTVLLFDEADALFGKRSEVKDSHDRYANIEVGYLLQRMEAYRGLAILTTNMKSALDKAFQRRIRFVVQFLFPDPSQREEIWRRAFPPAAPTEGLDPCRLAKLSMAGGSIRNIALNAAFLAADAGEPVRPGHVLQAARSEAVKIERPLSELETRGLA